jgi:RNA polymerase sigma-70 factor (ECF subfamily)
MIHIHEPRPAPAPGGRRDDGSRPNSTPRPDRRDPEEEEHVRRAIAGDGAALDWLARRFRPFALRVALRLVGNLHDAEDVCQDAFATLVERIGECRQPECFVAWLLKIVRNRGISLLRRRGVRATVSLDAVAEVAAREHPERDAERAELRGRLAEALDGLTRLQREVVVLYDLQGWPHAEIAARLGITEGAARVHLHNARRALRARLAADGPLERAA